MSVSSTPVTGGLKNVQSTDWLTDQRRKRAEDGVSGSPMYNPPANWNKDLHNDQLSQRDKVERVKEKARVIEERAMQREQLLLLGVPTTQGTVNDTIEVNDMLIDAIKAKLAILDEIK